MISIENSRGGRVKVVGIRGIYQKLRKKHGFPGGSMQRNGKFQEVNLTGNPGGSTSNYRYPQ